MVVRTDANAAMAEYGRELGSVAVAIAMGESVRLTDAEVDAIVHGDRPAGMGEQPSIMQPSFINRDLGDENRAEVRPPPEHTDKPLHWVRLDAPGAIPTVVWWHGGMWTRFAQLELYTPVLMAWIGYRYLGPAEWHQSPSAAPPAPSTAPTPPPHNPMANALAHSEPKPAWPR